jgi:hypothetical protein
VATTLLEKEVLDGEDVKRLVGPLSPSPDGSTPAAYPGNNRSA